MRNASNKARTEMHNNEKYMKLKGTDKTINKHKVTIKGKK